jgi:hypothetical protein
MANTVKIKRSSVSGKIPTTSQVELGELAVNTHDGKLYTKKDDGTASIVEIGGNKEFFSITNTGTTAGTWLGSHSDITSYFDGMTIAFYQNNIAGASTTTLNINNLGAKTIYAVNDNKLTTHYGPRALIMLQYDSDQDRFYAHDFYYADTYRTRWQNDLIAGSQINGRQLLMEGIDGKMYPVTAGGVSSNTKTVSTQELRVGGLMVHFENTNDYAADAVIAANAIYTGIMAFTMEFWHNYNAGWATTNKPWYIVCTMNANGNFVLDNSSYTSFLTQTLPSSDDGKFYIMGGWMHNNHDVFRLQTDHPIYVYKNGAVRLYSGYSGDADKLDGIQASSFVRSDANDTVSGQLTFNENVLMGGTGAIKVANGTTSQRPSATNGMVRYNTTLGCLEVYVQSAWQVIANTSLDYGSITAGTTTTFDYGGI